MERGFNDDELADIMNEIESLEEEFTQEVNEAKEVAQAQASQEPEDLTQGLDELDDDFDHEQGEEEIVNAEMQQQDEPDAVQAHVETEPVQETSAPLVEEVVSEQKDVIGKLADHEKEKPKATQSFESTENNLVEMKPAKEVKPTHSSMSFKVSGEMSVDLSFDISGKQIGISVNESEGLVIDMGEGGTFNLPLPSKSKSKKAA